MRRPLFAAFVLILGTAFTAQAATPPKPKPRVNDGLPRTWYGRTTSTLRLPDQTVDTSTRATFTLAARYPSSSGTQYQYRPTSGDIRVEEKSTSPGCTTTTGPADFRLQAEDAILTMWVPKPGKRPPLGYDGSNAGGNRQIVTRTTDCPSTGTHVHDVTILPAWFDFPPRPFRPTTQKLVGTFRQEGSFTYEWCLARRPLECPEE